MRISFLLANKIYYTLYVEYEHKKFISTYLYYYIVMYIHKRINIYLWFYVFMYKLLYFNCLYDQKYSILRGKNANFFGFLKSILRVPPNN